MSISERIKSYESACEHIIPKSEYIIIRIDGHHFSKFTRGFKKPFDHIFRETMIKTTEDLHNRFNSYSSFTQSDEITLFLPTLKNEKTGKLIDHQFNGRTQKLASLVSSYCTVMFNKHLNNLIKNYKEYLDREDEYDLFRAAYNIEWDYYNTLLEKQIIAYFDARVFSVPSESEVANVFIWRARDCIKNSKATFAQAYASHKELQNKNSEEQIKYVLEEYNKDWNKIEDMFKYGVLIKKELYQKQINSDTVTRSKLKRLYIPMNTYSDDLIKLLMLKNI